MILLTKGGIISAVHQGSLAEELELVPGDKIISINEQELTDIIDLSFALADEEIEMLIETRRWRTRNNCF